MIAFAYLVPVPNHMLEFKIPNTRKSQHMGTHGHLPAPLKSSFSQALLQYYDVSLKPTNCTDSL